MGENIGEDKPDAASLHGQDPSHLTPPCQLDSAEPVLVDKKRMIKRKKISPSISLNQLDSVRSSSTFSFGLESRSMVDPNPNPNPTPRFGPLPPVIEEQEEESNEEVVAEEEEEDRRRESKRRKHCPSYIVSNFSFNLDHNSNHGSPESTPKFGSFTLTPTDDQLEETQRDHPQIDAATATVVGASDEDKA